jgi:hypothetical protein
LNNRLAATLTMLRWVILFSSTGSSTEDCCRWTFVDWYQMMNATVHAVFVSFNFFTLSWAKYWVRGKASSENWDCYYMRAGLACYTPWGCWWLGMERNGRVINKEEIKEIFALTLLHQPYVSYRLSWDWIRASMVRNWQFTGDWRSAQY